MSIKRFLALVLLFSFGHAGNADECGVVDLNCLQRGSVNVDGAVLNNVCIRVQKTENCAISHPLDSCVELTPLALSPDSPLGNNQCRLTNESCSDFALGQCIEWAREYECFNSSTIMGDAVHESRHFSNFQEKFSTECNAIESNPTCSFDRSEVTSGYESFNINARTVTRSWWQRQHRYDCSAGTFEDTCQDLDASPICRQSGEFTCISHDNDGRCIAQREEYLCESDTSFAPQCAIVEVCEDGSCDPEEDELSTDYVQAASWLNFLDSASKNNKCQVSDTDGFQAANEVDVDDCVNGRFEDGHSEPLVFRGNFMYCESHLFSACQDSVHLHARIQAGNAHYLRSVCQGIFCTSIRHHYCTYNSKFARVFQEQANLQTGVQFTDECPAFTIDQLETLDVEAMDLSEIFGDMLDKAKQPIKDLVIDRLSMELGVFKIDMEGTFGGGRQ